MNFQAEPMIAVLQSAWTAAARMAQALRDEYQALARADSEALGNLANDKLAQMNALEQARSGWERLLAEAGLPAGNAGMQQWLKAWRAYHAAGRVNSNIDAAALWKGLGDGFRTISKLNGVNGAVIAESDRHIRDLIGTLRGGQETRLYGMNGRAQGFDRRFTGGVGSAYSSGNDLAVF